MGRSRDSSSKKGKGKQASRSPRVMDFDEVEEETLLAETDMDRDSSSPSPGPRKKRKGGRRSKVCGHYEVIPVSEGAKPVAVCKYCGKEVPCHSKDNGTSGLWSHVRACDRYLSQQSTMDDYQTKMTYDASSAVGTVKGNMRLDTFDEKKVRRSLAEFVIQDEQPFVIVEKEGFKKFVQQLEPHFHMISRSTVARDCMGVYLVELNLLIGKMTELSPRVCLTTDTWTSIQNLNYMCLTAHFIDKQWQLHKRVIDFRKIVSHTGRSLAQVLDTVLGKWGIDKVLTITVDNASANTTCLNELKERMSMKFADIVGGGVLKQQNMHMRCSAHILNLIVQDGLKEMDTSIVRMRSMIKYVKSSPQREETFKKHVDAKGLAGKGFLQLDVCTRWNSTYNMLQSVDKHRVAFEDMLMVDDGLLGYLIDQRSGDGTRLGVPMNHDWECIKTFINFLKVFYDVTLTFSASNTCTAHRFMQELYTLKKHLDTLSCSSDEFLSGMAGRMLEKYTKYWGAMNDEDPTLRINRFLLVATILDPMSKITWFEFWLPRIMSVTETASIIAMANQTTSNLFDEYNLLYGDSPSSGCSRDETISISGQNPDLQAWTHLIRTSKFNKQSELDRYLSEGPEPPTSTLNILEWWKSHEGKYPMLARMAQDILAIPITTVPSELVFSTSGRVLSVFRSSLAPKTTEGLICSQNWLRQNTEILFHRDGTKDSESYQLDAEMHSYPRNMLEGIGELPKSIIPHEQELHASSS